MSHNIDFTVDTGVQVYFCDPHSPEQRGSNENSTGLLRKYLLHGTDLTTTAADRQQEAEASLNRRPRRTLAWSSPAQACAVTVAMTD